MGELEDVLAVVANIHGASIDPTQWPKALKGITDLVGGLGASLEVLNLPEARHAIFHGWGLPAVDDYLEHYAPLTKRLPYSIQHRAGTVFHEGMFIDEDEILSDAFYMEFLAPYDMRYFLGGVVANSSAINVLVGVQRSPKQGLPTTREQETFASLMPHLQQAYETMRRLDGAALAVSALDAGLAWLNDAVLVLNAQGRVLHANPAAERMMRGAAFSAKGGELQFAAAGATEALHRALARLNGGDITAKDGDFVVPRPGGTVLTVAVRPLRHPQVTEAAALVFIRDVGNERGASAALYVAAFGLTPAEAKLAEALAEGVSPEDYAHQTGLSPSTALTHLRRIKDKCGQRRTVDLVRTLNSVGMRSVHPL